MPSSASNPPPRRAVLGPLRCLYEDDWLIAVDKPAGLLSVPGRGPENADCVVARMALTHPEIRVVHRLDMGTSGILILAKHLAAQQALSRAFERRLTQKRYEAVVYGLMATPSGEVHLPLRCDWPRRPRQMVDPIEGKPASTLWQCLSQDTLRGTSRVSLTPITGRSHQLRVHLQSIGHPIVGDELYAPTEQALAEHRMLLHACALSLPHPEHGASLHLSSAPPF